MRTTCAAHRQPIHIHPEMHMQTERTVAPAARSATPTADPRAGALPTAVQLLRRSLETFLAKDIRGWVDLCAEDVVAEFPFSPDPATRRIVGREALYAYLKDYPAVIDLHEAPTMHIVGTDDPDVAIAEWSVSGRVIPNGNPYEMRYATFVTFRGGLVATYREYWNPQAFMAALDGARF